MNVNRKVDMNTLKRFLIREDKDYDYYGENYQAVSMAEKAFYIFFHLLPGLVAYAVLNIEPVHDFLVILTGMESRTMQYMFFFIITFGWHMVLPFVVLRYSDKLTFKESIAFLGLGTKRMDWQGIFVFLPVVIVVFTLISIPYMAYVFPVLKGWIMSVPALVEPEYSLFAPNGGLYDIPAFMLLMLLVGNFLGEELYFRGYLMKKTTFLGKYNWLITSCLFSIYHFWQAPTTWSYIGLVWVFGLVMHWRKNLYVPILLHIYLNLGWGIVLGMFLN